MTPQSLLEAYDFAIESAKLIPNNGVILRSGRGHRRFTGHKTIGRFLLISQVQIGPRGGVNRLVCLVDRTIKPTVDAIRVIDVPSGISNQFFPNAIQDIPSDTDLTKQFCAVLSGLPSEESFYASYFSRLDNDSLGESVNGLQGGAPGLRR